MRVQLQRPVNIARLSREETHTITADETERTTIADALDLVSLDSLTADVTLRPWRGDGVRIIGTVTASLRQECVVTLEPVATTLAEDFDVRLHPDVVESETVEVDPEAPDPPEPLRGDVVDIGSLVLDALILGLDPYPRAPEASFEPPGEDDPEPSPFAALSALKGSEQ